MSSIAGRGAKLFVGTGEAFDWRNYELTGTFAQKSLLRPWLPSGVGIGDKDPTAPEPGRDATPRTPRCFYRTGVVFYADPEAGAEYRLEVTGPLCFAPRARVVKVLGGARAVLAETAIDTRKWDRGLVHFHVEVANGTAETMIRARLRAVVDGEVREWFLEAEDRDQPLRRGTVGAWGNFVKAAWDDFHVAELAGMESGISGDADGDGICDVEAGTCGDPVRICLDQGYDRNTRLSTAVVAATGAWDHRGLSVCGHRHSYWLAKRTGVLVVRTPDLEGGRYRFRLLLQRKLFHFRPVLRVRFPSGESVPLSATGSAHEGVFGWSAPIEVELPAGAGELRIESTQIPPVAVEGIRLDRFCAKGERR